jgi:hypothetical protein
VLLLVLVVQMVVHDVGLGTRVGTSCSVSATSASSVVGWLGTDARTTGAERLWGLSASVPPDHGVPGVRGRCAHPALTVSADGADHRVSLSSRRGERAR